MRPLSVLLLLIAATNPAVAQEAGEGSEPSSAVAGTPENAALDTVTPAPQALLLITVNVAGATLIVDERQPREAPAAALRVALGPHAIVVRADGYETFEQSVQVPGDGARVDVFLEPSAALTARIAASEVANEATYETGDDGVHKQWWFWAAVGGGVVVVAGVIAAIALASGGDDGQAVIPVPPIPGGP